MTTPELKYKISEIDAELRLTHQNRTKAPAPDQPTYLRIIDRLLEARLALSAQIRTEKPAKALS